MSSLDAPPLPTPGKAEIWNRCGGLAPNPLLSSALPRPATPGSLLARKGTALLIWLLEK